jgi:6-pyruvoyltetrahydropterin/6-carboxytetrahydropterin synthase
VARVPSAQLTRRVRFAAAHRYRRPEWSDEKNAAVFGACARPNFHGHTYRCSVTVEGEVDHKTGMVMDLVRLDAVLAAEVVARFDHRNINLDVPEFGDGLMIPTGENLARYILLQVQRALGDAPVVRSVTIEEDENLAATVVAGEQVERGGRDG